MLSFRFLWKILNSKHIVIVFHFRENDPTATCALKTRLFLTKYLVRFHEKTLHSQRKSTFMQNKKSLHKKIQYLYLLEKCLRYLFPRILVWTKCQIENIFSCNNHDRESLVGTVTNVILNPQLLTKIRSNS